MDVNTANRSDTPPLVAAATYGHEEVVRLLIDAGAKANYKDGCLERTALCSAAGGGHLAVVQLLVDRGADLNYIGKNGMTPLGYSASRGHRVIVEFLLKRGAELDTPNDRAPLWMASASGHIDVASLLLTAGAKKDLIIEGRTALVQAVEISHTALVQLLLSHGADPNIHHPWDSPLSNAIKRGNVEIVQLLLQHGASPCPEALDALTEQKGNKALFNVLKEYGVLHKLGAPHDTLMLWAARRGYIGLVECLVDQNTNINIRDSLSSNTPLLCAVAHCGDVLHMPPLAYGKRESLLGWRELVAFLIEKKADLEISDMHGQTPLLIAAKHGDKAMVQLLLDKGANIRSIDNMGQTALVFGIQNRDENILDLLLTCDPGLISVRDKFGRSPLLRSIEKKCGALIAHHIGNESSHRELTELIINKIEIILQTIRSTGVNISPEEGAMLIAWAAANGYLVMVEVLLEMNVKADHEDEFTRIPFLQAIANNHLAVIDWFLQKCHNPNKTDQEGQSALSWGFYSGNEAIVQLLLERGADPNSNIKQIFMYWEGPWNRQGRWKFRNSDIEWPPLFEAAAKGFERCVGYLLQVCTNPGINIVQEDVLGNQSTDNALSLAVKWKHYGIVEMLLAHGVDDDQCHSSLALAMQLPDQKLVTILTQRIGSKWLIAEHGKSLLFQAAYSGYIEIVSSLLDSGMEPDTRYTSCSILSSPKYGGKLSESDTPLLHACRQGHRAVVQLLLERGADANLVSPFDCAGETIFSTLLQFGMKIDVKKEGHILFFDAVKTGRSSLVEFFLKMGVCPEPKDQQQMHPLFIAVSAINMDVLRVLLDSGMDPNTKYQTGRTCLCLAAEIGLPWLVEFLMQSGCQPQIIDDLGRTPLFFATLNAHKAVVELLVLKANADANATTCAGRSPVSIAQDFGYTEILNILTGEPGEPPAIRQQVSGGGEDSPRDCYEAPDYESYGSSFDWESWPIACVKYDLQIPLIDKHYYCAICCLIDPNDLRKRQLVVCMECAASGKLCLDELHTVQERTFVNRRLITIRKVCGWRRTALPIRIQSRSLDEDIEDIGD